MSRYANIQSHHAMIFDDLRNNFYFDAIKKLVNKDNSVVLDLGAGLGIHGFMALSVGVKKVYFVEPASIVNVTKRLIETNSLSEKVECLVGKIEEVELPEKVDVITSVFTGNFLLFEDLLPSLFYARDKFLRPGGKLIPDRGRMIAVPVSASEYYNKHIECWSNSIYNIDFSLVRKFASNSMYSDKPDKRQVTFLSKPVELVELDFMTATEASCRTYIEIKITQSGKLHGWLGWFDARVGEKWLSTSPMGEQMHWSQVFLPLDDPIDVKKGDKVSFELSHPEFGEWSWIVEAGGKRQTHSTFLSEPISPFMMIKKSVNYKPVLSEKGKVAKEVFELLSGNLSISEIIYKVQNEYPTIFPTFALADQFVKSLVEEYS